VISSSPRVTGYAGIVDENVDRAEPRFNIRDHTSHGAGERNIGSDRGGSSAISLNVFDDGSRLLAALTIVDRDSCSCLGQRYSDRLADASRAARNQRDPVLQIRHMSKSPH
jgi:hypothetical protein